MPDENNKIKNLVSAADEESVPTLESATTSRDQSDSDGAALQDELRISERNTDRLLFDVEQLRARCTGLDKELQAREKLTDRVNLDLNQARDVLDKRDNELTAIKSQLAAEKREHDLSQDQIDDLRCALEGLERQLQESESRARGDVDDEALRLELADKEGRLATLEKANQQLTKELGSANFPIDSDTQPMLADSLGAGDMTRAESTNRRVADNEEFRELREQLSRTEEYADNLRAKLKNQIEASAESLIARQQLEFSLENALAQARDLKSELENERLLEKDLRARLDNQQQEFDQELRMIRFELGGAQETITDHLTINEQLTSDLIDNQTFRQGLEDQLSSTARKSEVTIRELDRRLRQKSQANDDLERKLENKDNAIAALLHELANRGTTAEKPNIVPVEREYSRTVIVDDNSNAQRVTRLLIGSVDGQELRFPLFKDRLTIGRTAHNDIQLRAQFVSRRHAVIVSDNGATRIVDWGSRNGVMVNRERVNERFLKNGDKVTIGTTEFRYSERPKR